MLTAHPPLNLPTTLRTVEEFEQWQRQYVTEGSYEFLAGRIVPKPAMKQEEFFIVQFLTRQFSRTTAYREGAELVMEFASYVDANRFRVPDLMYVALDQIDALRRRERISTRFAIELLSDSESFEDVAEKVQDYFDAGVQLVWYVAPNLRRVYVYTSPDKSQVFKGQDVLSAAPLLPDFRFTVADLFANG